jgi:hypothetical protein
VKRSSPRPFVPTAIRRCSARASGAVLAKPYLCRRLRDRSLTITLCWRRTVILLGYPSRRPAGPLLALPSRGDSAALFVCVYPRLLRAKPTARKLCDRLDGSLLERPLETQGSRRERREDREAGGPGDDGPRDGEVLAPTACDGWLIRGPAGYRARRSGNRARHRSVWAAGGEGIAELSVAIGRRLCLLGAHTSETAFTQEGPP